MFGQGFTWRWGGDEPVRTPASLAEQEEFKKWQESSGSKERSEFEDWRAWQEWKKKNPK